MTDAALASSAPVVNSLADENGLFVRGKVTSIGKPNDRGYATIKLETNPRYDDMRFNVTPTVLEALVEGDRVELKLLPPKLVSLEARNGKPASSFVGTQLAVAVEVLKD